MSRMTSQQYQEWEQLIETAAALWTTQEWTSVPPSTPGLNGERNGLLLNHCSGEIS